MKSAMLAGVFTMTLIANACAATTTCPPIERITQTMLNGGGYGYTASEFDGRTWLGENPLATESYLADSAFHDARYDPGTLAVTCTYTGPMNNDASVSVTLKSVAGWNLTPSAEWRGTYCEHHDVAKCAFTHQ